MKTQILKAVDLCKSFANNGGQNHVLDMINLEIYKGDFTVIMGSSGAGKSTLLYTLSGMDTATNGKIYYKDKELNSYAEKQMADIRAREFGFIFQPMHLISNLTILENAAVVGYLGQKKSTKEVRERALALLTQTHVEHAKDRLPSQVSGGEAQYRRCAGSFDGAEPAGTEHFDGNTRYPRRDPRKPFSLSGGWKDKRRNGNAALREQRREKQGKAGRRMALLIVMVVGVSDCIIYYC